MLKAKVVRNVNSKSVEQIPQIDKQIDGKEKRCISNDVYGTQRVDVDIHTLMLMETGRQRQKKHAIESC